MDNPDANRHRFHDALDVVYRPGIDGQCLYPLPFPIIFELRLELMHRMQATEHVSKLTFIFTTLVLIAATQGEQSAPVRWLQQLNACSLQILRSMVQLQT